MSPIQQEFVSELLGLSMTGEDAGNFLEAAVQGDVSARLGEIRVPTLVIHARGDSELPGASAAH
jgi:pimeloyl-ACP methyl ester carboxylesterase